MEVDFLTSALVSLRDPDTVLQLIDVLLQKNPELANHKNNDGITALMIACKHHKIPIIKRLLEANVNIELTNNKSYDALYYALKSGSEEAVELIIQKMSILRSYDQITPLHVAVVYSTLNTINLLIARGCTATDDILEYALTHSDKFENINCLLQAKYPLNPLMIFNFLQQPKILSFLLDKGVSPNVRNTTNQTPLMVCYLKGFRESIDILVPYANWSDIDDEGRTYAMVAHGIKVPLQCDLNAIDHKGRTALIHSIIGHKTSAAIEFIKAKVNLQIRDHSGKSALMHAISKLNIIVVEHLLKYGADLNIQDCDGTTAVMQSVDHNMFPIFANYPFDINLRDNKGNTLLMYVVQQDHMEKYIVDLIDKGIDINAQTSGCTTALWTTVQNNDLLYTKILLERGANPNIRAKNGCTLLLWLAQSKCNIEMLKLLLAYKADPNVQYKSKLSAIHYMSSQHNLLAIELLLKHGAKVNYRTSCPLLANLSHYRNEYILKDLILNHDYPLEYTKPKDWAVAMQLKLPNIVDLFLRYNIDDYLYKNTIPDNDLKTSIREILEYKRKTSIILRNQIPKNYLNYKMSPQGMSIAIKTCHFRLIREDPMTIYESIKDTPLNEFLDLRDHHDMVNKIEEFLKS